jgi:hypothetical protein
VQVKIRVKGHLDPSWQEWLEGLQIEHAPDGTSRLSGTLTDQPALSGLLTKLSRLSLTLLSLECVESARDKGEGHPNPGKEVRLRRGQHSNTSVRQK